MYLLDFLYFHMLILDSRQSPDGIAAAAGVGSTIVGVFALAQGQRNLEQQKELADATAAQLDRHHAENLKAAREQGRLNRAALTKGLGQISDVIQYLADNERISTINRIGQKMEPFFDDPQGDHPTVIQYLSSYFNQNAGQLSFEDVTSVTNWWIFQNPNNLDHIENKITITKQFLGYWTGEFELN